MKETLNKLIGVLLITAAVLGILLSLSGGVLLWRSTSQTEAMILSTAETVAETLQTTDDLMGILQDMLSAVEESFALIEASLGDSSLAIDNTADMTDSLGTLMGEDMADVLDETLQALNATKQTARLIDDTLKIVSALPLIGARYAPDVTLESSIEQVSNSLDPVPDALDEIENSLQTASTDLSIVKDDLDAMQEIMGDIKTDMGETVVLVETYHQNLGDLQDRFESFEEKLPRRLQVFNIGTTVFLVWLFISQLGLLTQGFELMSRK